MWNLKIRYQIRRYVYDGEFCGFWFMKVTELYDRYFLFGPVFSERTFLYDFDGDELFCLEVDAFVAFGKAALIYEIQIPLPRNFLLPYLL